MPQEDPLYYDSLPEVYNIPELSISALDIKPSEFFNAIVKYKQAIPADAITGATPGRALPKPLAEDEGPWQQLRE